MKTSNLKLATLILSMGWLSSIAVAQNPNSNAGGLNWKITGNQATATDFIGTTNNQKLVFKCNNVTALEITPNSQARFMDEVLLDKLKPIIPMPPGEVRIVTSDNNGKLTSLDKSDLLRAIYDPTLQCKTDQNGLVVPTWSAKGLTPTLGALFTGVNCPAWVGIGTDNPIASLDVRGKGFFASDLQIIANASKMVIGAASSEDLGHGTSYLGFNAQRFGATNGIWQTSSDGAHNGGAIIYGDIFGSLRFVTLPYTNTPNQGQNTVSDATVAQNTRLFIHKDGNVGIGTDNPTNKFEVCGTIRSKEWIVETGWCDFKFDDDYNRMNWIEKQDYITKHKHLPELESASNIETYGLYIAKTLRGFVWNIEDNTLDIIELFKENQFQKKKLDIMEDAYFNLKKRYDELEERIVKIEIEKRN